MPKIARPCCAEKEEMEWMNQLYVYTEYGGEKATTLADKMHTRSDWKLKCSDKWRKPKCVIPNHRGKEDPNKAQEPESEILKEMRKK